MFIFVLLYCLDLLGGSDKPQLKFQNLRPRLTNLLISALQYEVDSVNAQMLLGGLLYVIQDITLCDELEVPLQQDTSNDSTSSLLASGNLGIFCASYWII